VALRAPFIAQQSPPFAIGFAFGFAAATTFIVVTPFVVSQPIAAATAALLWQAAFWAGVQCAAISAVQAAPALLEATLAVLVFVVALCASQANAAEAEQAHTSMAISSRSDFMKRPPGRC
jgi:hypothetical protein